MKNKIIDFLEKEILNNTPTTKSLIYKDKTVDVNDIDESYKKLVKNNEE